MTEIMENWPWYDRFAVGALLTVLIITPWYIMQQLGRIIELLERIARKD